MCTATTTPCATEAAHLFIARPPSPRPVTEVVIRFCVPCRYQPKAMQDADAILKEFGEALSGVRLVPGDRGIYDVEVDGDLGFSLVKAHRFPESPELIRKTQARIDPRRTRRKR